MRRKTSTAVLIAAGVFGVNRAWGDNYISTASGDWTTTSTWTDATNPSSTSYPGSNLTSDDAYIEGGLTVTISGGDTIGSPTATNDLGASYVGGDTTGAAETGTLDITGGTLYMDSDLRLAKGSSCIGTVYQSNGLVDLLKGNFLVSYGTGSSGTYNLSGGTVEQSGNNQFFVVGEGATTTGIMNQTGGNVFIQSAGATFGMQLGRTTSGGGTYNLSAGNVITPVLSFGSTSETNASTNTFSLSGSGRLVAGTINVPNTGAAAVNTFSMTGGRLTANIISINLTNNGGTMDPATVTFPTSGSANADPNAFLSGTNVSAVGTTTLTGTTGYTQTALGTLDIDLASASSYDSLALATGNANIGGTIAVDTLGGYDPAPGTTFDIVTTGGSITDTATVTGTTPSGNTFSSSVVGGDLVLTVVGTPEPASLSVVGVGAMCLLQRRRRRAR